MEESGMEFLEDMRFFIVDRDIAHLESVWDAFRVLGYDATMCQTQECALSLLRKPKHGFDIILVDISVPCEIGFKFLKLVSKEMKLQIIMMSSVNEGRLIADGIYHGASECVLKPVLKTDLQRFWLQALGHRRRHLSGVGNSGSTSEGLSSSNQGANQMRKEGNMYKSRLVWTQELQDIFVAVVDSLGGKDQAIPSKIQEQMGVPGLTREKIASHLQKYRISFDKENQAGKRKRRSSQASMSNSKQVNGIDEQATGIACGNRHVLSFVAPELNPPNAQDLMEPYIPEVPTDTLIIQEKTMPEIVANSSGQSLELQNPTDGNQSQTSSSMNPELEGLELLEIPASSFLDDRTLEEQLWSDFETSSFGQGPSNGYCGF